MSFYELLFLKKLGSEKSGIQGVKINGTEIPPDANNKVNISTSSFFTSGTFVPNLICTAETGSTPTQPTYTGVSSWFYYLIDNLCYISFLMNLTVTSKGVGYYVINSLPFTSSSDVPEMGITLTEFNLSDGVLYSPTITMFVPAGTSTVQIENLNGRVQVDASLAPDNEFNLVIGGSGFYITS